VTEDFEEHIRIGRLTLEETPRAIVELLAALDAARAVRAANELQTENDAAWECFGNYKEPGETLADKIRELQRRRDEEISASIRARRRSADLEAEADRMNQDLIKRDDHRLRRVGVSRCLAKANQQIEQAICWLEAEPIESVPK